MNALQLLQLILGLGNALLGQLKLKTDVPQDVLTEVQDALALLQKVQGSAVTFGQLEGLRLGPEWGTTSVDTSPAP